MTTRLKRRDLLGAVAAIAMLAVPLACKQEERCRTCGMKIDRASPWRTELVGENGTVTQFDSPRCALRAWRGGVVAAKSLRVQEYYDRRFRDANDVRFVVGGDVTGPMGPDLVPVDPPRVTKFIQDHGADRAYTLAEITPDVVGAK